MKELNWDKDPYEIIFKMAKKIHNSDYDLFKDIYQAGCEAYLLYGRPDYFPTLTIKYYMLNELTWWKYEASYQNNKKQKTVKRVKKLIEDWATFNLTTDEHQIYSRLQLKDIYKKLNESDKKGKTKHVRTFNLIYLYGPPEQGVNKQLPIKSDTYWSACKSLQKFLMKECV